MNQRTLCTERVLRFTALAISLTACLQVASAQVAVSPEQELQRLSVAVDQAQAQVDASQKQLLDLKQSLALLQAKLAESKNTRTDIVSTEASTEMSAAPASRGNTEQRDESQEMQQSELATLNQIKVESSSKYPVTIHGLILLNGFTNSSNVDIPLAPSVAFSGSGSTGASLRQTSFGIDARGPMLAGATSRADFDVDFLGNASGPVLAASTGLVRLRTAHAALEWRHTKAFFEFDRPLLNPYTPTSLVSNAQPALAWSGNLWQWVPQAGLTESVLLGGTRTLEVSAAFLDDPDVPNFTFTGASVASAAEQSRSPGGELHLELGLSDKPAGASLGVGGLISPHSLADGHSYNAWAGTLDWRLPLPVGLVFTGNAYRGLALGGLGGGSYKDLASQQHGATTISAPLDNVGGWAQLKKPLGERLELNAALGVDQAFAKQLAAYPLSNSSFYGKLARNRTAYGNVIWSPSAYLLFSFEYRRITSYSVTLPTANSNVFGVAAGYKF